MSKAREVALLVGAGDAIGAAVARRFAEGGYIVCIARRDGDKSKALAEELTAKGQEVRAFSVDARKEEEVQQLFATVERDVGSDQRVSFQRRLERQQAVAGDHRQVVFQGLGACMLCGVPGRP